jgi:hypothetical protein
MAIFVALLPSSVARAQPPTTLPNGRVVLEGIVRAWHGDTLEGVSIDHGAGLDIGGQLVTLNIDDARAHELAGKRVRMSGNVANGRLTPDSGGTAVVGNEAVAAPTSRNVAVILMHFNDRLYNSDLAAPVPSVASVTDFMFNNSDSVRTHFEQSSDGLATITGSVLGWYTIPYSYNSGCNYNTWSNAGRSAAQAAGVNLSSYQYFVYVFPTAPGCGWAGLGELPGSQSWSNGYINHEVFVHELGHNWGVHHASSMSCVRDTDNDPSTAKVRVPISGAADCTVSEYGDPFGIMGSWNRKLHNNWHRAQLGWLPDQQSVTTSGRYSLAGVNGAAGGPPRLLSIARGDGTFLVLELRQADAPFDSFTGSESPANGISLRITPSLSMKSQSKLVDATPATTSFGDAALPVGSSVFDPISGVTVTNFALAGSTAQVDIAFSGGDLVPPSTPANLSATAVSSSSIQLAWTASTDNVGVTGYRVKRNGVVIGTTALTSYTDGGLAPSTTYAYEVSAYDAALNDSSAASASATTPAVDSSKLRVSAVQVSVATGKNKRDQATAVVTVVNEAGTALRSVNVTGTFRKAGVAFSTKSGTTASNGTVTLQSAQTTSAASGVVYEFCVTNATLAGYTFDAGTSTICGQTQPKP